MHTYKIAYNAQHHPGGISAEELEQKEVGGCDSIVILSLIYPNDGSCSLKVLSMNGMTGEPDHVEMFKAWAMMASELSDGPSLHDWQRQICDQIHEAVRTIVVRN